MLTRSSVNRFGLPVRVTVILGVRLLQWLNRFIFIHECVAAFVIAHKVRHYASDCIWTLSVKTKA